ncbi:MAG: hypothetical protein R2755_11195 [Acidimicrobiales bacterium]
MLEPGAPRRANARHVGIRVSASAAAVAAATVGLARLRAHPERRDVEHRDVVHDVRRRFVVAEHLVLRQRGVGCRQPLPNVQVIMAPWVISMPMAHIDQLGDDLNLSMREGDRRWSAQRSRSYLVGWSGCAVRQRGQALALVVIGSSTTR